MPPLEPGMPERLRELAGRQLAIGLGCLLDDTLHKNQGLKPMAASVIIQGTSLLQSVALGPNQKCDQSKPPINGYLKERIPISKAAQPLPGESPFRAPSFVEARCPFCTMLKDNSKMKKKEPKRSLGGSAEKDFPNVQDSDKTVHGKKPIVTRSWSCARFMSMKH